MFFLFLQRALSDRQDACPTVELENVSASKLLALLFWFSGVQVSRPGRTTSSLGFGFRLEIARELTGDFFTHNRHTKIVGRTNLTVKRDFDC